MAYREARSILNRPKLTGSTGNLDRAHNLPICTGSLSRLARFVTSARRASLSNSGEMISRWAHQVTFHKSLDYDNITRDDNIVWRPRQLGSVQNWTGFLVSHILFVLHFSLRPNIHLKWTFFYCRISELIQDKLSFQNWGESWCKITGKS
jgi:hypothetical protein